jgi:hypothetical protein
MTPIEIRKYIIYKIEKIVVTKNIINKKVTQINLFEAFSGI